MAIKRKKKLDVDVCTKDLIVDEAERLIDLGGIDGLKLDDIAESLGVRRPSLYAHFNGRDGILAAVAEKAFAELALHFQILSDLSPRKMIEVGVRDLVEFLSNHKAYALLLARDFSTPGGLDAVNVVLGQPGSIVVPEVLKPVYNRLDEIFARGQQSGEMKELDSFVFLSTVLGATMACLLQHQRDIDELADVIVSVAFGLLNPEPWI